MIAREMGDIEWLDGPLTPGTRLGRRGDDLVFEWDGVGRVVVSREGRQHAFVAAPGLDPAYAEKFRATAVLAFLRFLDGGISLHGSAVHSTNGAIALVGNSGSGKSTTALALVESGAKYVADDVVPVDWIAGMAVVQPVTDGFWLTAESAAHFGIPTRATDKHRHFPAARVDHRVPLLAIVELVFDESRGQPTLERVSGVEAFLTLARSHLCFGLDDDAVVPQILETRARLCAAVPFHRLARPRSLANLDSVRSVLATVLTRSTEMPVPL